MSCLPQERWKWLKVAAELNAKDSYVSGSVDFGILFDRFAVSVVEVGA